MLTVHAIAKAASAGDGCATATVQRVLFEPSDPKIPPGAIWIDLINPTIEEDETVKEFLGARVPTKAHPGSEEPPEAHYSENGVRFLHALLISEPEDTPDVTSVTFVIASTALVTVRYHPVEAFELFSRKLCKVSAEALSPDLVALGLINTSLNCTARALRRAGESLDRIASAVFRAKGDRNKRSQVYSETLDALGREDEKISNLRESIVSVERGLLFLMSEGYPENAPSAPEATKTALRGLQIMEHDASFKAQKLQFLLDSTLGRINLLQNELIKLFSVAAVVFMPPTMIASIYGMNFSAIPAIAWRWGYPFAIMLMICAAIGSYVFFRWRKWL